MRSAIIIGSLLMLIVSCRKFDHEADSNPRCTMCAHAESLEGSYNGEAEGLSVASATNLWNDSLRITVEHVFLNKGSYYDSTIMWLKLTKKYKSLSTPSYQYLEMRPGYTFVQEYEQFVLDTTQFRIYDDYFSHVDWQMHVAFDYLGIRE
ncbi:MAG: hypothetical protein V4604_17185 [Bacteroidota bacterium]